ncbi:TetR/AcrR family transcriptional regulator [Brasilonema sp. UFV-L1]|uniref:TetR/AcrR family transcriptional regulator n=1 Tax=Brasilonema sp. UFV-L1 TaxID=2234130 RepID=UPI00145E30D2|nr:TetR/AcrR family transcriptional regulator [Brasilonema sp. UFV-L1]NMG08412.1 TetR family transcriptional regulator [Brasilonema sp. UFV-L1]
MSQLLENKTTQKPSPTEAPVIRRRNQRSHQAILKATAELLEEKGYRDICIEAIASRAGVGKQTIYRWWPSKAAVVMEAYSEKATQNIPTPDTGSVKQDLYQILQQLFAILTTTTTGTAVTGLIAEAQMDASLAEAFREQFIKCRRAATRTILERGIARGELRPDLNLELVIDTIYGPIWYRLLLKHATLDDAFAEELVNFLIVGIQA